MRPCFWGISIRFDGAHDISRQASGPDWGRSSGWAVGLMFGILISAGDAVITKAYAPILGIGAVGGAIIGYLVAAFGA